MKLNEVNVGDSIRITCGEDFVKEGSVITKVSNGIVLQTDLKHQMFFSKDFFSESVNIDIIAKNSEEIIVEEVLKITPEDSKKIKCGERLFIDDRIYIVTSICYGGLALEDAFRSYVSSFINWNTFNTDREIRVIRKVDDV